MGERMQVVLFLGDLYLPLTKCGGDSWLWPQLCPVNSFAPVYALVTESRSRWPRSLYSACFVVAITLVLFILVTQTVKVGEGEIWIGKVGDNTAFRKNQATSCHTMWGPRDHFGGIWLKLRGVFNGLRSFLHVSS